MSTLTKDPISAALEEAERVISAGSDAVTADADAGAIIGAGVTGVGASVSAAGASADADALPLAGEDAGAGML